MCKAMLLVISFFDLMTPPSHTLNDKKLLSSLKLSHGLRACNKYVDSLPLDEKLGSMSRYNLFHLFFFSSANHIHPLFYSYF